MPTKAGGPPGSGWVVAAGMYSCLMFSGSTFFAFSLFVKPIQAALEWSRSDIMAGFSLVSLSVGIASFFAGKAVDRFGPRRVMILGAIGAAAGYALLSMVGRQWLFYLGHVVIGAGGAAMGPVPASAVVSSRFKQGRGLAVGIMSMGIGFGGLVFSPLIGGMVIPVLGWRAGYLGISAMILTLIPLTLLVIESGVLQTGGKQPAAGPGEDLPGSAAAHGRKAASGSGRALLSAPFALMACGYFMSQFGLVGAIQSQVPYLQDIGFPVAAATGALGGVGLMSALGKLFFGWLCDRIKPKYAFSIGAFLMAGGTFLLMTIRPESSLFLVWGYALTIGLGAGSWLPAMVMLVSGNFGMACYGSIFGAVTMAAFLGSSAGPLFAGFVFDATRNYQWAFAVCCLMCLSAIPAMMAVRPVPQPAGAQMSQGGLQKDHLPKFKGGADERP